MSWRADYRCEFVRRNCRVSYAITASHRRNFVELPQISFGRIDAWTAATMLRLKPRRRAVLVETLRELANLTAGALVLAQFVGQRPLSVGLALAGVASWVALVVMAVVLAEERSDE